MKMTFELSSVNLCQSKVERGHYIPSKVFCSLYPVFFSNLIADSLYLATEVPHGVGVCPEKLGGGMHPTSQNNYPN